MQTRARVTSRSRFIAKRRTGSAIDITTSCPVFTSNTTANGSLAFSGHTVNVDTFTMTLSGGTIVSVNGNPVNNTTYNGTITNLLNTTFVLNVPLNGNYVLEISSSRSIDVICAGDGPRPAANIAFSCPSSGNFDGFDIAEGTFTFTSHTNTDTFTLNMTGGTISTINGIPVNDMSYTGNVVGSMIPFTILVPIDTNYTLNLTTSKGAQFNCAGTGGVSTPPQLVLNGGDLVGNDLNFPDTVIDTTSSPLTFDISGTFVNFPITIVSNSPRFIVDTASIPAPIGGNLSATPISVTFNPTAVQAYNSTITITCGPTTEIINLNGSGIGVCALSNMVAGTSPHSIAFAFDTPPAFNTGTLGIKRTNLVNFFNQTVTDTSSPHQFLGIQPDQDYDWRTTIDCGGSPVVVNSDPIIHTEPLPCEYGLSAGITGIFYDVAILTVSHSSSNTITGRWYVEGTVNYNNFVINSPTTEYIIDYESLNIPDFTNIVVELQNACLVDQNKVLRFTFLKYSSYITAAAPFLQGNLKGSNLSSLNNGGLSGCPPYPDTEASYAAWDGLLSYNGNISSFPTLQNIYDDTVYITLADNTLDKAIHLVPDSTVSINNGIFIKIPIRKALYDEYVGVDIKLHLLTVRPGRNEPCTAIVTYYGFVVGTTNLFQIHPIFGTNLDITILQ